MRGAWGRYSVRWVGGGQPGRGAWATRAGCKWGKGVRVGSGMKVGRRGGRQERDGGTGWWSMWWQQGGVGGWRVGSRSEGVGWEAVRGRDCRSEEVVGWREGWEGAGGGGWG